MIVDDLCVVFRKGHGVYVVIYPLPAFIQPSLTYGVVKVQRLKMIIAAPRIFVVKSHIESRY